MFDTENPSYSHTSDIAELNNQLLFDYGSSIKHCFNIEKRSNFSFNFFK
ncbi:MAG: hypothetical protein ACFFCE_05410 [Promethearchaeota archaeon]